MEETWSKIKGYEDHYEISDHGRVRSLDRVVEHPTAGHVNRKGKEIKLKTHKDGYWVVTLHKDSKRKNRMVHQLVLETFVSEQPEGQETRHLDGNPKNNHVSNLAWGTPKENSADIDRHGRRWQTNKTHCAQGHPLSGENLGYEKRGDKKKRVCLTCRREKDRKRYAREKEEGKHGTYNGDKTHCNSGHEFTPENTYQGKGRKHRTCRKCHSEAQRARRAKKKENVIE